MQNNLSAFLNNELNERGWSQRELARRSRLSPTSISEVISGKRGPGPKFCRAVAKALGVPVEQIFQMAGMIDPLPKSLLFEKVTAVAKNLNDDNLQKLLEYAQLLLQSEG